MLLRAALHAAVDCLLVALLVLVGTLQYKEFLVVGNHLRVDGIVGATTERQVVDGIQQVGLPHPVVAYQTVHFRRQIERCLPDILIMYNVQFLENHTAIIVEKRSKVTLFMDEKRKKSRINFTMCRNLRNFVR